HFALEARQLHQVDRPPHPPGDEAGEVDAEDVGDAGAAPDGGKLAEGVESERPLAPPADDGLDVAGKDLALPTGVLTRGRIGSAVGLVRHARAVAEAP